jgi:hypothetical protein
MDPGPQFAPQPDATPIVAKRKHPSGCLHCANVTEYHMAREAAQVERERVTGGYKTETKEYGPIITFKDWLVGGSRQKDHSWH